MTHARHPAPRADRYLHTIRTLVGAVLGTLTLLGGCGGATTGGNQVLATQPADFIAAGPIGGPYESNGGPFLVATSSTTPTEYEIACESPWVTWDVPTTGTIPANSEFLVHLEVDAEGAPVDLGLHETVVHVRNSASGAALRTLEAVLDIHGTFVASGPSEGPFLGDGGPFEVRNRSLSDAGYEILSDQAWVTWATPTSGTILPGESIQVRLGISAQSAPVEVGDHHATIRVRNPAAGRIHGTVQVKLTVFAPGDGWTLFEPSEDTNVIHVSFAEGDDTEGDGSQENPFKSLQKGYDELRDGYPDWLLLKRGDTWIDERWTGSYKSGRSALEPQVLGAYGASTVRPTIRSLGKSIYVTGAGEHISHVAIVGLYLQCKVTVDPPSGFKLLGKCTDFLLEDLFIEGFSGNVNISPNLDNWPEGNEAFRIRRCVIVDAGNDTGHSQGLFVKGTRNLLIEECVFDHNGWRDLDSEFDPSKFNHNMYISAEQEGHIIRNNIVARASATGIYARSGGMVTGNLVLDNPGGIQFGYGATQGGVSGTITGGVVAGNVVSASGDDRVYLAGISTVNLDGAEISENIIAHNGASGKMNIVALLPGSSDADGPGRDLDIHHNIIYKWFIGIKTNNDNYDICQLRDNDIQCYDPEGYVFYGRDGGAEQDWTMSNNRFHGEQPEALRFYFGGQHFTFDEFMSFMGDTDSTAAQVAYPAPDRTIADYLDSGSLDAFMTEARKQSRFSWRTEYTAKAVVKWFQGNFGMTD